MTLPKLNYIILCICEFVVRRFAIIHTFGGIYVDLHMESVIPIDSWIGSHDCITTQRILEHPLLHQTK